MKNSLHDIISKASIPILDDDGKIASYAFIMTFPVVNDSSKVIPFLIINFNDVKDLNGGVIAFNAIKNNEQSKYNVSFDREFIRNSKIGDYLVHPIAALLNDAASKGLKIDYFGIDESIFINFNAPNTRSIEELTYIVYKNYNFSDKPLCVIRKNYNATPFYSSNEDFFLIIDDKEKVFGFPVLLVGEGFFNNEKGLCLGNRVIFAGTAIKRDNDAIIVRYPKKLADSIKEKFSQFFTMRE